MNNLDKIKSILAKMGISEETSKEFATILEDWSKAEKTKLRTEFADRLSTAKKACVEEVESYKANLARGVQTFLESKVKEIERAGTKQRAIEESEATNRLKQLKAVLEGINVDEAANAQALQSERKANVALKAQMAALAEGLQREKAKLAKFTDLMEKSIQRQKTLEEKLKTSAAEPVAAPAAAAIKEDKIEATATVPAAKPKTMAEAKVPAATPVTTNSKKAEKPAAPTVTTVNSDIDAIASSIGQ